MEEKATNKEKEIPPAKKNSLKSTGKRSVFFQVRHAERADIDESANNAKHKNDPELTAYGREQAQETGRAIIQKILKLKREKKLNENVQPKIVSSPYWRCLQTAALMIEGFGKNKIKDNKVMFMQEFYMQ